MRRPRRGPCGKITYKQVRFAKAAIIRQYELFSRIMKHYWCNKCRGYHIARKMFSKPKQRGRRR